VAPRPIHGSGRQRPGVENECCRLDVRRGDTFDTRAQAAPMVATTIGAIMIKIIMNDGRHRH
jgi:hypothetical protein